MNYHRDEPPKADRDPATRDVTWLTPPSTQEEETVGASGARQPQSDQPRTFSRASGLKRAINALFKLLLPFLVIAAGSFATWSLVATKPPVDQRPPREQTYAVQTSMAQPADHQPDIILFGTVSAARKVDLRALVSGEVIWINPDLVEGKRVAQGASLVRIDPFDYEGGVREAQANLAEAKAKMAETLATKASDEAALDRLMEQEAFARTDLERAEKLLASGSLTRQALESRKLTLSQRQQAVEARQNNLTVLKARIEQQDANLQRLEWRLEQARRLLADTTLKAPFNGLVQSKSVEPGRSVSGNDTLVSLYDPDEMDVRLTLSDSQFGRLVSQGNRLVGRAITVNWKLGETVRSHQATITRITPEVNAANGGVEVFARLAVGSGLRAGTFVEAVVPDKIYRNAVQVPQAAIYDGNVLYVNIDGRMQPVSLEILAYQGDQVLVDGAAVPEGTEIIITRVAEAGPGLKLAVPDKAPLPAQSQSDDREASQ